MSSARTRRSFIVGGAGFIGSHFVGRLLDDRDVESVTVYDNFSSGRDWHLDRYRQDRRLTILRGEVADLESLTAAMAGHTMVVHLASNPDIARAMTDPTIDFHEGTALTHFVAEAARLGDVEVVVYASGSGVYGDLGEHAATEDHGPLVPVSTYGASKLAGEALLCSYAHMFDVPALAFRFANVVGPNQTHGVGFDFVRKLLADPSQLPVLGDGTQSKSYIHVDDVLNGVLAAVERAPRGGFDAYNLATVDHITVREIAEMAIDVVGLDPAAVQLSFGTGDRGWKGDVPVVRLSAAKLIALGWSCERTTGQALRVAMESMLVDARSGRLA